MRVPGPQAFTEGCSPAIGHVVFTLKEHRDPGGTQDAVAYQYQVYANTWSALQIHPVHSSV
jgi:hypothetical protein